MSAAVGLISHACGHQTPTSGPGRTTRVPCGSCRSIDAAIGPRIQGGRYWSGYWSDSYTVVRIDRGSQYIGGWQMVVEWSDGHRTCHATAWSTRLRDRVFCPGCASHGAITAHYDSCPDQAPEDPVEDLRANPYL